MTRGAVFPTVAGAAAGSVGLFVIGAFVGGNLATDFEFAGLRGYEATGILGLLLGLIGGASLGARLARKRATR